MTLLLILKSLIVIVFLILFLRRPSLTWGIGLLAATTAVLLDTFLGTFGREEMLAQLGFFFYIISGAIFGGAAVWVWGLLRPLVDASAPTTTVTHPATAAPTFERPSAPAAEGSATAFDRQMLYDQIRQRLGHDDILDLLFDLGVNENDVISLNQDMNHLIIRLMDWAETNGQTGPLALAVERILTPPPPENLPRLEKISEDSPPTILRHYLLAYFDLNALADMARRLNIDWEQLGGGGKKEMARGLLLYLYRRNRIGELVDLIHVNS